MFRISQFMRDIADHRAGRPLAASRGSAPPGPVVIWNLVRRCNLTCKHCYSISADKDFAGELSTEEIFRVLEDLRAFRVPALILSGGEPLLRADIHDIGRRAKALGFYTALSSNGTLMDEAAVARIAEVDYDYVGVSLDGLGATHDRFRRLEGAFDRSLAGIRRCRDAGLKVGVRFTLTQDNFADLPGLLRLVETEGVHRFYFSHLNYAGRGNKNRRDDAHHRMTREAMDLLFDTCWDHQQRGLAREFTTGNNDADGPYLLQWLAHRFEGDAELAATIRERLVRWGGNASGQHVANIDNLGQVHADTMWWHYNLGSVRERAFADIWQDTADPLMAGLKQRPRPVKGRCAACAHLAICNGNTRVRAQQTTGDAWAEDPGCYLTDEEIGVTP
jgi:heme d1 biosynthesis radical SAM protein NirJ